MSSNTVSTPPLTTREVARRLNVSTAFVRQLVGSGELKPLEFSARGGRWYRFSPAEVERLLEEKAGT
jgi:excisionase family DNA binding protein